DPSHPRYKSLLARGKLEEAAERGMLAGSALIAHGRGEAFDYLLGEETSDSALKATKEAVNRLIAAKKPVISLNGNTTALAGLSLLKCAAIICFPMEINIFYRTPERMSELFVFIEEKRQEILSQPAPLHWKGELDEWKRAVEAVEVLGALPDAKIPGLQGPRAKCHKDGIFSCDAILVPLEDGDRCEALVKMGKNVLVVALHPKSRSAIMANVTIVDEVCRFAENLFKILLENKSLPPDSKWNNDNILRDALSVMARNML
ncbi:MAG: phosphopantothenate/pantothenate synthetase, partial [Nitrospinae bacterium]|nr:phosphopantothenate/pantothenate synthetase [Nitrospinota bacterium]